jgi:arylsulfatase A-like enzyme
MPERDVFVEYHQDCLVRGDWKVVLDRGSDAVTHCFDLSRDPYELEDLAGGMDASLRQDMIAALGRWRSRIRG